MPGEMQFAGRRGETLNGDSTFSIENRERTEVFVGPEERL
jgi:hypothetical protein